MGWAVDKHAASMHGDPITHLHEPLGVETSAIYIPVYSYIPYNFSRFIRQVSDKVPGVSKKARKASNLVATLKVTRTQR
jgi:hypothetical protein